MKLLLIILLSFVLVVYSCHPSGLHSKPFKPITSTPTTSAPAALSTTPEPQSPVTEAPITTTTITTTTTTTESSPELDCDPSAICDFEAIDPMLESPYGFFIRKLLQTMMDVHRKKLNVHI
ncbi:uncharacterized protein CELE_Y102A5C.27 [Caenorhabditis elegans]|uniref:Uncharacterized protein n=1 Tax=Caenorhabditis elegans TaxID=6239 RepID=Q9XX67_CAEEL|nr:Uncharacterized protein CELE_Y102A5C.27 [Caenorhabditis elegans]CAA20968.2 Uncharacterized protein CELE_Y102A5C.27 [Caenorhabditis elegans]|eukprot:NP_507298.2 Uncharacterized protein CELE_Y102A5C.27 [Caenorhabditis elegans]